MGVYRGVAVELARLQDKPHRPIAGIGKLLYRGIAFEPASATSVVQPTNANVEWVYRGVRINCSRQGNVETSVRNESPLPRLSLLPQA
jgi:hypothetical protein